MAVGLIEGAPAYADGCAKGEAPPQGAHTHARARNTHTRARAQHTHTHTYTHTHTHTHAHALPLKWVKIAKTLSIILNAFQIWQQMGL